MQRKIALVLALVLITMGSFVQLIAQLQTSLTIQSSGTIIYVARPLHIEGKYIKDDLGNTTYLRGVNFQGYSEDTRGRWPYQGCTTPLGPFGAWDDSWVRYNYQVLRDEWGGNAMRWHCTIQWWIENKNNYRYWIRRGIELAQEYGIYIILDFARLSGADWNKGVMPFYPYDNHTINGEYFYEQDFIDFWVSVATELKDLPNWLIDPYNEPHRRTTDSHFTDRAVWFNVVKNIYQGVRVVCNNLLLIQWMEGVWYVSENQMNGGTYGWVDAFIDYMEAQNATENIVISTHLYRDNHVYMGGRPNTLEQLLDDYTVAGLTYSATEIDYPLILGEVGCNDQDTERHEQEIIRYQNALTLQNQWGIGYLGWVWARYGDRPYALVASGPWNQGPSESGQILMEAIKRGRA